VASPSWSTKRDVSETKAGDEAELPEAGGETLVPGPRSLFQTIERALQKTNIIRVSGVDEAWRLLGVHSLLQMTMKKSILHVQLVNQPGARSSKVEWNLCLKIHLPITMLAPGGQETRRHVPLSTSALYSSVMAACH
jgi:hypothetical protein